MNDPSPKSQSAALRAPVTVEPRVYGVRDSQAPASPAVALKVTGDPVAPSNVAWAVCAPAVGPSVQVVALIPSASVATEAGATDPADADQVTVTFSCGSPPTVTSTRS